MNCTALSAIVREKLHQNRTQPGSLQTPHLHVRHQSLFQSPAPLYFGHHSTILSLWRVLFPEIDFPENMCHGSVISQSRGLQGNLSVIQHCSFLLVSQLCT